MLSRQGSVPRAEQLYRTLRRVNPAPYAGEWHGVASGWVCYAWQDVSSCTRSWTPRRQ